MLWFKVCAITLSGPHLVSYVGFKCRTQIHASAFPAELSQFHFLCCDTTPCDLNHYAGLGLLRVWTWRFNQNFRSMLHSTLIRGASLCGRWQLTQKPTIAQFAEKKKLVDIQLWMGYLYHTSPLKAQESMRKRGQKDSKSRRWWIPSKKVSCFPNIMEQTHIWTQRNCDSETSWTESSMKERKWAQSATPNQGVIINW